MNDFMMYLMSNTSLSIKDADRVLYGLRFLIPDIPKSIRGVLKTCPSVQPKFIGSGVYYHLGLKTNLLRYVELWLCTIDFDSLKLYVNIDGLSMSRSSNQQLWPILGRIIAPRLSDVFMIGIYGGNSKPAEFNEFSADTISEIKEMTDPTNKKYVIVDVLQKKQLMIASKDWIVGNDLCLLPNELVEIHLQKCDQPNENWTLMKCKVIHELDSLQSAKDLLVALQVLECQRKNTSTDENTLPLNTEKPKRSVQYHHPHRNVTLLVALYWTNCILWC
ncbi:hypothetical protein MS3_00000848 [Schistosoma haematobium]|uniref:Uncharacterized protein n=1 Tax=Schistosoma haematobium TaxID=6185 RepID=A0A922LWR6_SCHHA|nr:hypothetical protein MS3_00000848 [Schistosoma haematobium]KAH9595574.1 hypothetical protein MS3_00000848 [Schistosoma haematobium]